jgi:TatD DNase family protein
MYDYWKPVQNSHVCSAAHSIAEWNTLCLLKEQYKDLLSVSFGIHPQNPDPSLLPFLKKLLEQNSINAIGEAGFDLYTDGFKEQLSVQKLVWYEQLELALSYSKPLVVHSRKALDLIFASAPLLKKIPSVVFHSYSNSPEEAVSLRKKGINAFFSFGKPLLNNHKNALRCAAHLPLEWILLETDGPYQTLRGECITPPEDIIKVYSFFSSIRNSSEDSLCQVEKNFFSVFRI